MQFHKIKFHLNKNGRLFGFGVSPNADWKILFVSSVLLVILACILGSYFFIRVNLGQLVGQKSYQTEEGKVFDEDLLKQTLEYYKSRAVMFEEIKMTKETVPDPSL
jgi:hypothetical protein